VSTIHGGHASNIIPEEVTITGTIRTLSTPMMNKMKAVLRDRSIGIAKANGCEADVDFNEDKAFMNSRGHVYKKPTYPALINDADLYRLGMTTAVSLLKDDGGSADASDLVVEKEKPMLVGEDFAFYVEEGVPSAMFSIGHQGHDTATAANVRAHSHASHTRSAHLEIRMKKIRPCPLLTHFFPYFVSPPNVRCHVVCNPHQHHHPKFRMDEGMLPVGAAFLAQVALDYLFVGDGMVE